MWIFEWPLGWFNASPPIIFQKTGVVRKSYSRNPVAKTAAVATGVTASVRPVAKTTMNRI